MNRIVLFSSLCAVVTAFSGCAANSGEDHERSALPYLSPPGTCSAGDPTCVPPGACDPNDPTCGKGPCMPGDTNCDPKQPPCDPNDPTCSKGPCMPGDTNCDPKQPPCPADPNQPADASCDPKVPSVDPCAAQQVKADLSCNTFLGWAWNGSACFQLSGCACAGQDCKALFKSEKECLSKFAACSTWNACAAIAKELDKLLFAARACNIASAKAVVCDGTFVNTVTGCPVPVASGSSEETKAYLKLYQTYAQSCPLAVPACPNPKGIPIACQQGSDVDSLIGQCALSPDGTKPAPAAD